VYKFNRNGCTTTVRIRNYDPSTDQFISIDPAVAQTNQPYAYVNDNPLNATDPLGLCSTWNPFCDIGAAAEQIAGATVQLVHVAENPIVAGVFLGVTAVATGGLSLVAEGTGALLLASASAAASYGAAALDASPCFNNHEGLACTGLAMSTGAGLLSTGGAVALGLDAGSTTFAGSATIFAGGGAALNLGIVGIGADLIHVVSSAKTVPKKRWKRRRKW
jgi:RHS repeat-associated protein